MSARTAVFRAAADYHAALAAYARALRLGLETEHLAQQIVGTSVKYRLALERLMGADPKNDACSRRVNTVRRLLHHASAKYNLAQRHSPLVALPPD